MLNDDVFCGKNSCCMSSASIPGTFFSSTSTNGVEVALVLARAGGADVLEFHEYANGVVGHDVVELDERCVADRTERGGGGTWQGMSSGVTDAGAMSVSVAGGYGSQGAPAKSARRLTRYSVGVVPTTV